MFFQMLKKEKMKINFYIFIFSRINKTGIFMIESILVLLKLLVLNMNYELRSSRVPRVLYKVELFKSSPLI
jgi:hypothetical protein